MQMKFTRQVDFIVAANTVEINCKEMGADRQLNNKRLPQVYNSIAPPTTRDQNSLAATPATSAMCCHLANYI